MEKFDLDIKSYTFNEILTYFNITDSSSKEELTESYNQKRKRILQLTDINKRTQLEDFLNDGYKILYSFFFKELENLSLDKPPKTQQLPPVDNNITYIRETAKPIDLDLVLTVDSDFRDNIHASTSTNFTFTLPMPINNVRSMKIISAEIPYIFYVFDENKHNNTFNIEIFSSCTPNSLPVNTTMPGDWEEIPSTTPMTVNGIKLTHVNKTHMIYLTELYSGNNKYIYVNRQITIPSGSYYADDMKLFINAYFQRFFYLRFLICEVDSLDGKMKFRFISPLEHKSEGGPHVNPKSSQAELIGTELDAFLTDYTYHISCVNNTVVKVQDMMYEDTILYTFGFEEEDILVWVTFNDIGYITNAGTNAACKGIGPYYTDNTPGPDTDNVILYNLKGDSRAFKCRGYIKGKYIYGHSLHKYLYIVVRDGINTTKELYYALNHQGLITPDILGKVQIKSDVFGNNLDAGGANNIFKERKYLGNVNIRKLYIKLIDKYGKELLLNDADISLTFQFKQRFSSSLT
jgi:hypothetical protein